MKTSILNTSRIQPARVIVWILCLGWAAVSVPVTADPKAEPQPAALLPVPVANDIKNAQAQVRELYKSSFLKVRKTRDANEQRELATLLLNQAKAPENELAWRYVCFQEARKMLEAAGDVSGTLSSIDLLAEWFDIDPLSLKAASLRVVAEKSTPAFKSIAEQALLLARQAERQAKFENLSQLLEIAQNAASKARLRDLFQLTGELRQMAPDQRREFEVNAKAMETLVSNPDDPQANLVVGRYLCLVEGDWAAGGPRLLKGSDKQLQKLAERESTPPQTLLEAVDLAEAWQALAASQKGTFKTRMLREAAYWYRIASYEATGAQKATCEKMISLVSGRSPRRAGQPGLLESVFEGTDFNKLRLTRISPQAGANFNVGPPAPGLPADNFSIVWQGQLKVPVTGKYTFFFLHDDGGRLWMDDVCVVDNWGQLAEDQLDLPLSDGWHTLKIELKELGSTAGLVLDWKRSGTERGPIPETALFHDPNLARVLSAVKN